MDRFGRPRFRAAAPQKPYGTRPPPPARSGGLLGPGPSPRAPTQYGSGNSYGVQDNRDWQTPRSSSASSLLGLPPKQPYASNRNIYGSASTTSTMSQQQNAPSEVVPSEVRHLMDTLGLSQEDMQKLSELPENELSVNNLARAIGDLKQEKHEYGTRSQVNEYNTMEKKPPQRRPDSYNRGSQDSSGYGDGRLSYGRGETSLLGVRPSLLTSYPATSTPRQYRPDMQLGDDNLYSNPANRHKPTGIKVTVKPTVPVFNRSGFYKSDAGSGYPSQHNRPGYNPGAQEDQYYDEQQIYGRNSNDQYEQPRNDSFSQNNRRLNNTNISEREIQPKHENYEQERRLDRERSAQQVRTPRGGLPRPVGTRKPIPPLMSMTPQVAPTGGLLGNPLQPNAQGLENLVAAVGGTTASPASSLLNPLMLATQADPTVLEAQIQAMKALQAQAIKLKQQTSQYYDSPANRVSREKERPRRRSPPRQHRPSAAAIDRKLEDDAWKEAQEMRSMRGRVLYIRYKSPRVLESDLRQLAAAFGRVTNMLVINPKIKNGHFQAFMEMEQWDCAAAMLEHYMAKSPNIKGCPVDVQRSNYRDLQLRQDQMKRDRGNKRPRSMSPIRKGTTQLPHKRERKSVDKLKPTTDDKSKSSGKSDEKPKLSITTSKSDRRVVTARLGDDKKSDKSKSSDKDNDKDNITNKTDAREILNRTRSTRDGRKESEKKESDRPSRRSDIRNSSRRSHEHRRASGKASDETRDKSQGSSVDKDGKSNDKHEKDAKKMEGNKEDDKDEKMEEANKEDTTEKKLEVKKEEETEADKNKEDIDPLDAIADELALHDEFVLMDEVGYDGEQKKSDMENDSRKDSTADETKEEEKKNETVDLERADLDLEDVNVDMSQDEKNDTDAEGKKEEDAGKTEEVGTSLNQEPKETLELKDENKEESQPMETVDEDAKIEDGDKQEDKDEESDLVNAEPKELEKKEQAEISEKKDEQPQVDVEEETLDESEKDETTEMDYSTEATEPDEEVNKNEDAIADKQEVVGDDAEKQDDVVAEDKSAKDASVEMDLAPTSTDDDLDKTAEEESQEEVDNGVGGEDNAEEENNVEEDKITKLQSVLDDSLREIIAAKEHLTSLTKVTKNKAAQAIAKKLKVCLEIATTRMESAQSCKST